MPPFDFASIMQAGQNLVPDFMQGDIQRAQLARANAETSAMQSETMARNREADEDARYQADLDFVLANPHDPNAIRNLLIKYPKKATALKAGMDSLDATTRRTELTQLAGIYSAAANGKHDLAASQLEKRITSDKAAGQDTTLDEEVLTMLRDDDPAVKNRALNVLSYILAGATGEQHFGTVVGQLDKARKPDLTAVAPGVDLINPNEIDPLTGQPRVVYSSPFKPQIIKDDQGNSYMWTPPAAGGASGGTPASSGAPQIPATGAAIEDTVKGIIPNVNVTSRTRSPAKNAAVKGQPNSYHLSGQARDFTPPAGMSMGELHARVKRALPGFDVLNEGDHVHVEPAGKGGGRPAGKTDAQLRAEARAAIQAGADPQAVGARLRAWGIK